MSEVSGGPGWWQASDGRWYPPESYPAGWPPPQETTDPGAPESPGSPGGPESEGGGPAPTGTGQVGPTPAPGQYPPGQYSPGQYSPGQYPPSTPGSYPPGQYPPRPPGSYPAGQYGQSPSPYFQGPPMFTPVPKTNGLAIAALVCSILWGFGVLSVVAIVLGFVARSQIRRTRENGNGLALAGIIVGGVGIVGAIVSIVVLAAVGTYIDEEFNTDAEVQLTADPDVCWEVDISNFDADLNREFDGCGSASIDLGKGIGRRAQVTKTTGEGPVSALVLVEGESRDYEVVIDQYQTAELSP